jgi:septal ring factor EnvC (AmiA/AmiB activator)
MGTPALTERTAFRSAGKQTQNFAVIALIPLLGMLAIAAIVVAVYALTHAPSTASLQAQVGQLQSQVASLRGELGSVKPKLAAVQRAEKAARARIASLSAAQGANASAADLGRLIATVRALQACIPQLQQQVVRLKLRTYNVNGWLTGAVLTNPASISPGCAHTLLGPYSTH